MEKESDKIIDEKIKKTEQDKELEKKIVTYPNFDDIKKLHELHVR